MRGNINEMVHFSIDDVSNCFQWIHKNQPSSIFAEPMLAKLRQWHSLFGLVVDCYVFEEVNGFKLKDLEDNYWEELRMNSSWLRFGWHQAGPNIEGYDVGTQIASAQRVSQLIEEKCSICGLSKVLRLHMFSGDERLMEFLKEMGTRVFLTADSEGRRSYNLDEEETDQLWEIGNYYDKEKDLLYKVTDLRMDLLSSGDTVSDMIERAYSRLNRCSSKRSLEVFCHEWKFSEISDGIEQFLRMIGSVKKRIYLNAAAIRANDIFFTDAYSDVLYRLDTNNGEINNITTLPVVASGSRYASLHLYKNKLWMVPWDAGKLLVYDFSEHKLTEVLILGNSRIPNLQLKCRKAVKYEKYLWLLLYAPALLVRIDMEENQAELIDKFPDGVTFDKSKDMPFKCMDIFDGELYLFSDSCSHNLKVDVNTGEIKIWNSDFNSTFGIILDQKRALLPPVKENIPIRIYDEDTRNFADIPVPEWMLRKTEYYAFWYSCRTKDHIYIMPHEANGIIRYSLQEEKFDFIKLPDIHYYSLRKNPGFSGYEALEESDRTWLIPYAGNHILCMEKNGTVSEIIDLKVSLTQFYEMMWRDTTPVWESPRIGLGDLLEEVAHNTFERYVMDNRVNGRSVEEMDIYQEVMARTDFK